MMATKASNPACPWCRAEVKEFSGYCWKCGARLDASGNGDSKVVIEDVELVERDPATYSFGIATLLLVTTLIAVCMALVAAAPGLGIWLAIVSLPPFIRTLMLVQKKKKMGRDIPTATKVSLYLGSLGVTIVITFVTLFGSLIAFCLSCFGAFAFAQGANGRRAEEFAFGTAILLTLAMIALMLWAFSKWVRRRWRRDMKKI